MSNHDRQINVLPPPPQHTRGWPWTCGSERVSQVAAEHLPAITILTPSYQQAAFLEETLRSVLLQNYPRLQYIVIDGGSTDGSVDVIRRYEKWIDYWVSERDRGQVDAINKGLQKATGDIVGYINSDDYYQPNTLLAVGEYFAAHPDCDWICGDTAYRTGVAEQLEPIVTRLPLSAAHCMSWDYRAAQPGMFWRRPLLGAGFDETYRYCFDHDLYVRLLLEGYRCEYLPHACAVYRLHEQSKTVAEESGFGAEFDAITRKHVSKLSGADRRWCEATLLLRTGYSLAQQRQVRKAAPYLLRAILRHPSELLHRNFWGTLAMLVRPRDKAVS